MKILFTGGGTAGHINPALATAKYIKEVNPTAEIRFAGAKGGIEEKLVSREGYKLYTYNIKGFQRSFSPNGIISNVKAVKNVFSSVNEAKKDLKEWRPNVIIGTGGYASFPMVFAGAKMGIKTTMLEVNAYPGVAVKYLSKMVDSVMISFKESEKLIPNAKKIVHTGSPIRGDLLVGQVDKTSIFQNDKPILLSFWGSVGAQYMNEKMCEFIKLAKEENLFNVIHATGASAFEWMPLELEKMGVNINECENVKLVDYIFDMGEKFAAADLVMCRGGASSLAEVCAVGKASIIAPSPYVTDNHQEKNARVLEKNQSAKVILEKKTSGKEMYNLAKEMIFDKEKLNEMGKNAKKMAVYDGTQNIYAEILRIASN